MHRKRRESVLAWFVLHAIGGKSANQLAAAQAGAHTGRAATMIPAAVASRELPQGTHNVGVTRASARSPTSRSHARKSRKCLGLSESRGITTK